jgi:hypothetical protein
VDTMDCVVDKAGRREEFTAGLRTDAEDVFTFYGGATGVVGDGVVDASWEGGFAETGYEAEFAWLDFSCGRILEMNMGEKRNWRLILG